VEVTCHGPLTFPLIEIILLRRNAILALADGTLFHGSAIGAECLGVGEVVFNTAMTGYQEILTDPSYARQIVTLTVPHVGNTGVNPEDEESSAVHAAGLVIRDLPLWHSNFRSEDSLESYLQEHNIAAIADIDTRNIDASASPNAENAIAEAKAFAGLVGLDLAKEVSVKETYQWNEGVWQLGQQNYVQPSHTNPLHVVAYDFGVKRNILRLLAQHGCNIFIQWPR